MSDSIKKFNDFCKKYDVYEDGVEEKLVLYLKNIFPKSYKKSQEGLMSDDEIPNPADIYGFVSEDQKIRRLKMISSKPFKNGLRIIHN